MHDKKFKQLNFLCNVLKFLNGVADYCDTSFFVCFQALPLVTVMVGDGKSSQELSCVMTLSNSADEPREVQFPSDHPTPGKPAWANYVKGVVANFAHGTAVDPAN